MVEKKSICLLIISFFILQIVSNIFIPVEKVKAVTTSGFSVLNEGNTSISNSYGIKGEILKAKKYQDCLLVLTVDSLYYIKDGTAKKYPLGTSTVGTSLTRSSQNVTITPVSEKNSDGSLNYESKVIHLDTGVIENSTVYNKYLASYSEFEVESAIVNSDNTQWFSALTTSAGVQTYKLFRIDSSGNAKEAKMYADFDVYNSQVFSNMSSDSNGNLYSSIAITPLTDAPSHYSLLRINNDLSSTEFTMQNKVIDYKVGLQGDIWILDGANLLKHMDKSGNQLSQYALADARAINIDSSGRLFILDSNLIKELVNGSFVTRVTLSSTDRFNSLSLLDSGNFTVNNENKYYSLTGTGSETIVSDSYVKSFPNVIRDNLGNVHIISTNPSEQSDQVEHVLNMNADGTSNYQVFYNRDFIYERAVGFNNVIYGPTEKEVNGEMTFSTISKIDAAGIHDYVDLKFPLSYEIINDMEVDSNGSIYCVTLDSNTLYKVGVDKTVQTNDLSIIKNTFNVLKSLIRDKYGNVYILCWTPNYSDYVLYKINDINNITLVNTGQYSYLNPRAVFLNEDNEIEMAFDSNSVFKLDSSGTLQRDDRYANSQYIASAGKIVKAADGTLFMLDMNYSHIYKKAAGDADFVNITTALYGPDNGWGAGITELAADNQGRVYITDFNTGIQIYDNAAPKVVSSLPSSVSFEAVTAGEISIDFNEFIMEAQSFNDISLTADGVRVPSVILTDGKSLVIRPKTKLQANVNYVANVPAASIKDICCNSLSSPITYSFRICAQTDINGDGKTDLLDLAKIAGYYNITAGNTRWPEASAGDMNKDNIVDVYDLVMIGKDIN